MAECRICVRTFPTLVAYFEHFKYHSSILPGALCSVQPCRAVFKTYETLRSHLFRHHKKTTKLPTDGFHIVCPVQTCGVVESTRTKFVSHIAKHLDKGTDVCCPFEGCAKVLHTSAAFRTHVCRYHRMTRDNSLCPELLHVPNPHLETEGETLLHQHECEQLTCASADACQEESTDCTDNDDSLFRDNFALLLLGLESKRHVPASTIQYILKEMQDIHNLSQQMALKKIAKVVSPDVLATIQSHLTKDDHNQVASGTMRSSYCRHKYYKTHFHFVRPSEISLGLNKDNLDSVYHYVPIESLIQFLMSSICAPNPNIAATLFAGVISGQVFEQSHENEIQVILYQDEFEIANPLGSARGNFKLLGVYMTLGNLPLHCRQQTASMQLVMLCRHRHVKEFGFGEVLRPLTEDLVRLEATGMTINRVNYSGRLGFIVGDNLGSHAVGGFTQNFSTSIHFCRYCLVRQSEFQKMPHVIGERRTPENYREAVECLAVANGGSSEQGIVCDSPFHILKHSHVCKHGLPPCVGHDLFEGVVKLDLALYVKYFVKQRQWFTYDYLNHRIAKMKYCANDLRNKPAAVSSQGEKLTGHAVQNWTFLRLLPLYIGSKIADRDDPVWELVRSLAEIVDIVMSPRITSAQVAYLKVFVKDYVTCRIELFPLQKLKPKHHYMLHYSDLIEEFGPLVNVWTMQFEGKHQYFKECIRSVRNFKNVTMTLSEKHQLYQSFLAVQGLFHTVGEFVDMSHDEQCALDVSLGHSQILHENVLLKKAVVNGSVYMVGNYVLISGTKYDVTFGLLAAIVKNSSERLSLLLKRASAALMPQLSLYLLQKETNETVIVNLCELLDVTPYRAYDFQGAPVIRLKYSFPEKY